MLKWTDLWRRLAGCKPAMDRFTAFAMTPNVQRPNSRAANVLSPIRHCEERRRRDAAIHLWTDLRRRPAGCKSAMDRFTAFAMTIGGVVRFGASRRGSGRCLRVNTASSPQHEGLAHAGTCGRRRFQALSDRSISAPFAIWSLVGFQKDACLTISACSERPPLDLCQ